MRNFTGRIKFTHLNRWIILPVLLVLLLGVPVYVVIAHIFLPGGEVWDHLTTNLLGSYFFNTIILMSGVAILSVLTGLTLAWLVTLYRFPGSRFFEWSLILPLALPTYIAAYTYAGMLGYTGELYGLVRFITGYEGGQYILMNIFNLPGAIIIFSLVLYPYVFVFTRSYFLQQSRTFMEVSASLGNSPLRGFFQVVLPMARPALIGGMILVLMEVLNDYGAVRYLGIDTFTLGIFTAWFSFGDAGAALKLSSVLLVIIFLLIIAERAFRGGAKYDFLDAQYRPVQKTTISGLKGWVAFSVCLLPFMLGFFLPILQQFIWLFSTINNINLLSFGFTVMNSFLLAVGAAALCVGTSLFLAYSCRINRGRFIQGVTRLATMGYAIPGAVIGLGVMIPFAWTDNRLNDLLLSFTGFEPGLILSGTLFALIFAYVVRFLAVGYNSVESGFSRINLNLDDASRTLGKGRSATLFRVNLPLLRGSLISACILVFIDVLKELPLTLILRPFNFDTLATKTFEFAIDERIAESAPSALVIVATGTVAVALLNRFITKGKI